MAQINKLDFLMSQFNLGDTSERIKCINKAFELGEIHLAEKFIKQLDNDELSAYRANLELKDKK